MNSNPSPLSKLNQLLKEALQLEVKERTLVKQPLLNDLPKVQDKLERCLLSRANKWHEILNLIRTESIPRSDVMEFLTGYGLSEHDAHEVFSHASLPKTKEQDGFKPIFFMNLIESNK